MRLKPRGRQPGIGLGLVIGVSTGTGSNSSSRGGSCTTPFLALRALLPGAAASAADSRGHFPQPAYPAGVGPSGAPVTPAFGHT